MEEPRRRFEWPVWWGDALVMGRDMAILAAVVAVCAVAANRFGWEGTPGASIATPVWPLYLSTWDRRVVWTSRIVAPLVFGALTWLWARRFFLNANRANGASSRSPDSSAIASLLLLGLLTYGFHVALGVQRLGWSRGLTDVFGRGVEYWSDVRFVQPGFLARFPEVGRLSLHGSTHPPGLTFLLWLVRSAGATGALPATLVIAASGALTIFPLYGAARRLANEAVARTAVVLFLFSGTISLFAVVSMDMVTMFWGVLALYGFALALEGKLHGGALWGVALGLATWSSFIALALPVSYSVILFARRRDLDRRRVLALASAPIFFLLFYGGLKWGAGYRPLHVYAECAKRFQSSDGAFQRSAWLALLGNPVAFLAFLGLPLGAFYARAVRDAISAIWRRVPDATTTLVLASVAAPLFCTLLGKPLAEVEHVYLLFVPLVAIGAAAAWCDGRIGKHDRTLDVLIWLLIVEDVVLQVFADTLW